MAIQQNTYLSSKMKSKITDTPAGKMPKEPKSKTITLTKEVEGGLNFNHYLYTELREELLYNDVLPFYVKKIQNNIRAHFINFLKSNSSGKYTDWLLNKFPKSIMYKSNDLYQIKNYKGNRNKRITNKYTLLGTGKVGSFIIDGEILNKDGMGYEFVLKIKLFKGTYYEK